MVPGGVPVRRALWLVHRSTSLSLPTEGEGDAKSSSRDERQPRVYAATRQRGLPRARGRRGFRCSPRCAQRLRARVLGPRHASDRTRERPRPDPPSRGRSQHLRSQERAGFSRPAVGRPSRRHIPEASSVASAGGPARSGASSAALARTAAGSADGDAGSIGDVASDRQRRLSGPRETLCGAPARTSRQRLPTIGRSEWPCPPGTTAHVGGVELGEAPTRHRAPSGPGAPESHRRPVRPRRPRACASAPASARP